MLTTLDMVDEDLKCANESEKPDKYKSIVKKLKNKVKNLEQELKDINHENYIDKEENLQDIRILSKENKLLEGIIGILLQNNEIDIIRGQCTFNEDSGEYRIPPFYLKNKQLVFPKLPDNQSIDMIRQMQDNRSVVFDEQTNSNKDRNAPKTRERDQNSRLGGTPLKSNGSGKNLLK